MKTQIKKLFLLPVLAIGLGFMLTNSATAVVIKNFNISDGAYPQGNLMISGSTLYGTTWGGGSGNGTIFKMNTDGTGHTVLYNFTGGSDGASPVGDLVLSGNTLYGTTVNGGGSGKGTVFKIVLTFFPVLTTLHTFTGGSDGQSPLAGLLLDGNTLYGTTFGGSASDFGTLFKIDTDGNNYAVLYNFTGGGDGAYPSAGLVFSADALYGATTAINGGNTGFGTVFKFDLTGPGLTTLYSFTGGSDASNPESRLVLSSGTLYGTSGGGGSSGNGTVFKIDTDGNNYAVLYNFAGGIDGVSPNTGVTISGSTLYGTTATGGSSSAGTVFKINTDGSGHGVLHHFAGGSDGFYVRAGVTLSGSTLYGTTFYGGAASSSGTVFKLDLCGIENFIVAAKNQVVPTLPVGAMFSSFGVPARNNSGNVAFKATLVSGVGVGVTTANNIVIYAGAIGAEAPVIRKDDFAPDATGTTTTAKFGNFSDPAYNNAGEIAFRGTLKISGAVTAANDTGLWSNAGGTMHLVAREGDVAPDTGGGVFKSFTSFALPDTGDLVFIGVLLTGTGSPVVTTANNTGIWVYDCSQTLHKVTQTGDSIVVNGTPKMLKTLTFLPAVAYSLGQSRSVNDAGSKLVYKATFTDLTTAILGANYQ